MNNFKSTEQEYIYKRFESLRSQIERDYFNLLSQANQIEADVASRESINDDDDFSGDEERIVNDLKSFKSNLTLVQDNLEREKFYLFKSFQGLNDQTSRSLIASLGDSVERLLFDKHTEFCSIGDRLSALVDRWCRRRRRRPDYLEDEDNAIDKISQKINQLRTRIDAREARAPTRTLQVTNHDLIYSQSDSKTLQV